MSADRKLTDAELDALRWHTPGPWRMNTAGTGTPGGKVTIDEYYVYSPHVVDDVAIASEIVDPITCKPNPANAALIAYAPDLLAEVIERRAKDAAVAELIEAAKDCTGDCVWSKEQNRLIAALAAVRGGA